MSTSRIPAALKAVFIESNSGNDVHTPPPFQTAAKLYCDHEPAKGEDLAATAASCYSGAYNPARLALSGDLKKKSTHPQAHLDFVLRSRGYSTKRYESLKSAYSNKPTPLQQASYDVFLIGIVRSRNVEAFRKLMSSGLSPNPCNMYGESLVHMVCRRGDYELLQILIDNDCSLQVADDYGRTPLHDACWAAKPTFQTVQMILEKDLRLFHLMDSRGHVPLNYVREEHWEAWVDFIDSNKDLYWPNRTGQQQQQQQQQQPPLTQQGAHTRPLKDPYNALSLELARMVSSGRMKPSEAEFLRRDHHPYHHHHDDPTETMTEEDDDDSFFSSEYDSSDDNDDYDSSDESILNDMSDLLQSFQSSARMGEP